MYRKLRREPWTCARCLRRLRRLGQSRSSIIEGGATRGLQQFAAPAGRQIQGISKRKISTATGTVAKVETNEPPPYDGETAIDSDERTLQKTFDSHEFWQDFSQSHHLVDRTESLLGIQYLRSPEGFFTFVQATKQKCDKLVAKTLAASTLEDYRAMARDMDRLSDLLCRVIDVSDFMRVFHQDAAIIKAATMAYGQMFEYMNVLNTTAGLNEQLKKALNMPEVTSTWSEEEMISAETLVKDFAHSAIDQSPEKRRKFVDLSNQISQVGTEFVSQMEPAKQYVAVTRNVLQGIDPDGSGQFRNWGRAIIPINSQGARQVMKLVEDEEPRREIYMAGRTSSKKQIQRLERLLLRRAELAKLTGFSSYTQMTLSHKSALAKTPRGVNTFLTSLNASNRGQLQPQIDELLAQKRLSLPNASVLQPWDIAFYQNALMRRLGGYRTPNHSLDGLNAFFSIGTVISGLSRLFQRLYGVRLVPQSTAPGEVWNPDVRRVNVVSDTDGHIAVIYCDLFARMGKQPNPAHFTLRCSREITAEEMDAARYGDNVNDGMPTGIALSSVTGKKALHQLPVIALMCDFDEPSPTSREPTLLSHHSVTTLFHEMGHAVHSILGRTSLQTIAGTRCAADFAELPSILMEYFALDPSVLKLYARHWDTNEPISHAQATALKQKQTELTERDAVWHNETQILMSLLDQSLHSESAVEAIDRGRFDSTAVYHRTWNTHGSLPEPRDTSWHGFFGHLYGYGGTYYSYLFDRAIARQVWRAVFRDGANGAALDRAAGEKLKHHVLRYGGGRDPWRCLEDLMGGGRGILAEGEDKAMLEVGQWGVGAGADGEM
jgi:mitochondrial intermediate peptidase